VAISIPLRSMDVGEWRMVWWAVFSSLPQPVGATVAYYFVTLARQFLPEALDLGSTLPRGGRPELAAGLVVGVLVMVPLAFV
jgi:ZIP family zinc transporter